jgi:UDP-N-acetylglucosamine 2-epimerase (non-hydrolysing)
LENVTEDSIIITGNTVIDALLESSAKVSIIENAEIEKLKTIVDISKKLILVTEHRKENHGQGFINIRHALKDIATTNKDVQIIYPLHLNTNLQKPVYKLSSELEIII